MTMMLTARATAEASVFGADGLAFLASDHSFCIYVAMGSLQHIQLNSTLLYLGQELKNFHFFLELDTNKMRY